MTTSERRLVSDQLNFKCIMQCRSETGTRSDVVIDYAQRLSCNYRLRRTSHVIINYPKHLPRSQTLSEHFLKPEQPSAALARGRFLSKQHSKNAANHFATYLLGQR